MKETTVSNLGNEQLSHCHDLLTQLRTTGPEHFNLSMWAWVQNPAVDSEFDLFAINPTSVPIDSCGTTACIAGHLMLTLDDTARAIMFDGLYELRLRNFFAADRMLRHRLARHIGMDVNLPRQFDVDAWFFDNWPAWAATWVTERALKIMQTSPDLALDVAQRHAEFDVIVTVLDQLVHGIRLDWWTPLDVEPTEDGVRFIEWGEAR